MSAKKKIILVLIDWYLPGRKAGGPVKSIESLVWAMKNEFDFKVLTTDTDLGENQPYPDVKTGTWIKRDEGCDVYYIKQKELSPQLLQKIINSTPHDFIYLNSLYSKWFSIVPLQLKKQQLISSKIILAPRGMLSKGALALKSFKKKMFLAYSKFTGLHHNIKWHATYDEEIKEIKKRFPAADVFKCANFSKPVQLRDAQARTKSAGEVKLFYLSRVSPVKNLHIALEALKLAGRNGQIIYDIYGRADDEVYLEECKKIASSMPSNIKVNFKGEIANEAVGQTFSQYHFLFLPTSNENFGHSIFESLQCGCPVIISNATPWKNLAELNCGWDIAPRPENYTEVLKKVIEMNNDDFMKMSHAALKLAEEKSDISSNKKCTAQLFS